MAIFIDSPKPDLEDMSRLERAYYAKPRRQYWNEKYQATERKDIFVFEEENGKDTIRDFALDDKIRFVDLAGTFRDLTFAVDATARTITLRHDGSGNQITLRKAAALIGPDGASLLTAANFHFVQTDEGVVWESSAVGEFKWLEDERIYEVVCPGRERMQGGPGDDTLAGGWCPVKLQGGKGDDTLEGRYGDNLLDGGEGQDILHGGRGDDILYGGPGDDLLEAGYGDNLLYGGEGQDILRGGRGDDELYGGRGDDLLEAGYGDNLLHGGHGDDELYGGHGDDELYGGRGDDILDAAWGDNLLYGGKGQDILHGGHGDDELYGGRGDDILNATLGDNRLVGGQGNDTLDSGWGADTFVFREGDGHDTLKRFGFVGWTDDKEDSIELHLNLPTSTTEAAAFASLQIEAQGDDTVIRYGEAGDTITLEDLWISPTLDDFDFVFVG